MKSIRMGVFFLLTALVLFAAGCVKENLDDCPDQPDPGPTDKLSNLVLLFEYLDPKGKDILADSIESIDVFIYDRNMKLYQSLAVDDIVQRPVGERSKSVKVEPGNYYIMSWANNIVSRSAMPSTPGSAELEGCYLYHRGTASTDRLHYAPNLRNLPEETKAPNDFSLYSVYVERDTVTYHTVSFMSAYRTVNVYLKGFKEIGDEDQPNPDISIMNLSESYDSFLRRGNESLHFTKNAGQAEYTIFRTNGEVVKEILGYGSFYVPHFNNESPVTIDIDRKIVTGGLTHFSLDMDFILQELNMTVEDGDCSVIDVLIELVDDTWVVVAIPSWLGHDIEGGWN